MYLEFPSFSTYVNINENKLVENLQETIKNTLHDSLVDIDFFHKYNVDKMEIDKILEDTSIQILSKMNKGL